MVVTLSYWREILTPFATSASLHIKNGLMRVEENYKRETKNAQNMRQIPLPQ